MRRTRISECNPRRVEGGGVSFDCPEENGGCGGRHVVGKPWQVTGQLPGITIKPSIRCAGACRMHVTVTRGEISFDVDSKSGPDPG